MAFQTIVESVANFTPKYLNETRRMEVEAAVLWRGCVDFV